MGENKRPKVSVIGVFKRFHLAGINEGLVVKAETIALPHRLFDDNNWSYFYSITNLLFPSKQYIVY